jgi:hypothetical protein
LLWQQKPRVTNLSSSWSTTIWRRSAHTTCIFYGVAGAFPPANAKSIFGICDRKMVILWMPCHSTLNCGNVKVYILLKIMVDWWNTNSTVSLPHLWSLHVVIQVFCFGVTICHFITQNFLPS